MGQVQASLPVVQGFDLRTQMKPLIAVAPLVQSPLRAGVGSPFVSAPLAAAPAMQAVPHANPVGADGYSSLPLSALVDANGVGDLDLETSCLATAVYFESKGEPLEGQLAVAKVVMNRAVSGRFPTTLCGVVKQHAQFSFVRNGAFPGIDANCDAWRKARAVARIALKHLVATLATDVLWYHADYVAPRWRGAMVKVEQIGRHIFYKA